jgi:hypothetical protein
LPSRIVGGVGVVTKEIKAQDRPPMSDEEKHAKQTRKKRRVEGGDNPPRQEFTLRLEVATFERLTHLVATLSCSRNEYIERLIEFDLAYRQRIEILDSKPGDL